MTILEMIVFNLSLIISPLVVIWLLDEKEYIRKRNRDRESLRKFIQGE